MRYLRLLLAVVASLFASSILSANSVMAQQADPSDWDSLLTEARGQTVYFNAWGGADNINDYVAWAGEQVQERFGVTLEHVKLSDTGDAVSRVLAEKAAGRNDGGAIDLIWINGENFAAMKQNGLLIDAPWAEQLPNHGLTAFEDKAVLTMDFTVPVDGQEAPWGTAQFTFYYDSALIDEPPATLEALSEWIAANPGRFTYAAPPDFIGTTFVKQIALGLIEDASVLYKPAGDADFDVVTAPVWDYLDRIHPDLWRSGRVFATDVARLKTLFADGETSLAMTFNPGEASSAILEGQFQESVRSFVLDYGSIGNAHFVAIPYNANAKSGAMVVANFLMSPEAQARKADERVWGDPTVLAYDKLDQEAKALFDAIETGPATLRAEDLGAVLSEPDASWSVALEEAWLRRYGVASN